MKAGTSDAAVLDYVLAKTMVGEGTDFSDLQILTGVELAVEEYGIGFRKGSTATDAVNGAIKDSFRMAPCSSLRINTALIC